VSREQDYSSLDRALHRLAFSSRTIQLSAADIERSLFGRQYQNIEIKSPVFITSLPRAGTTLLLEIFSRIPGFATHRYRDMPFILAPLLWQRISGHFRKQARLQERAHGDGMQVGYDSPEAFEEVVWRAFWPQKYRDDGILPWTADEAADEFRDFLTEHMQKIIALRMQEQPGINRYVSKNNANIARLALLRRLYPDAVILIPFRNPVDHAASMLRQHENFLSRHAGDPFSRKYMQDIGHFEFGELHRPIRFDSDGPARRTTAGTPETLDYWLAYWIDAFEHIAAHREQVLLLSYERACEHGSATLEALAERVDAGFDDAPADLAGIFRSPPGYDMESRIRDSALLEQAGTLHRRLLGLSIV
jgi:hypothetical protein